MFDVKNIAPLFKLEMGLPGNSFAFELARKTGLPEEIIKDAEGRAGEEFVGIERNLRKIARNRKALDEKLERIKHTDRTLESITDKYQKELLQIKKLKQEIIDEAKKEAEAIIKGANRQVESTIKTIRESQADKEQTQEARKGLQDFMSLLTAKKEQEQKEKEDYIEKKIRQLDARKERQKQRKAQKADAKAQQEQVEIQIKYEGYILQQNQAIEAAQKLERKALPADLDYTGIRGLRLEAIEKLNKRKPLSIGQASRISGVSPADITVLLVWLEQHKEEQHAAEI